MCWASSSRTKTMRDPQPGVVTLDHTVLKIADASLQVRRWRLHRWIYRAFGDIARTINPVITGLDAVLRTVLPVRAVSPPGAYQRLPGALDPQQVPTLRRDLRRPPQAHGDHPRVSPNLHALALGHDRLVSGMTRARVTGDCHAGICGSRRVKPSGYPALPHALSSPISSRSTN